MSVASQPGPQVRWHPSIMEGLLWSFHISHNQGKLKPKEGSPWAGLQNWKIRLQWRQAIAWFLPPLHKTLWRRRGSVLLSPGYESFKTFSIGLVLRKGFRNQICFNCKQVKQSDFFWHWILTEKQKNILYPPFLILIIWVCFSRQFCNMSVCK